MRKFSEETTDFRKEWQQLDTDIWWKISRDVIDIMENLINGIKTAQNNERAGVKNL